MVQSGTMVQKVTAAVSDTLPVSVLLGTDVPELGRLLGVDPRSTHSTTVEAALVMTRAQASWDSDDLFFSPSADKVKPTRRERRATRHEHGLVRARDPPQRKDGEGVHWYSLVRWYSLIRNTEWYSLVQWYSLIQTGTV